MGTGRLEEELLVSASCVEVRFLEVGVVDGSLLPVVVEEVEQCETCASGGSSTRLRLWLEGERDDGDAVRSF